MGYNDVVKVEAKIIVSTAKAHLIEPTMGPPEVWVPKSQITDLGEPDEDGLRIITIKEWFAKKEGLDG